MSRRVKEGPHHLLRGVFFGAVVAAIVPAGVDAEPSAQRLFDVTAEAGIDFVHTNGASPEKRLPETFGSGVAILDVDGDGRQDLYFVNSGHVVNGRQGAKERALKVAQDALTQTLMSTSYSASMTTRQPAAWRRTEPPASARTLVAIGFGLEGTLGRAALLAGASYRAALGMFPEFVGTSLVNAAVKVASGQTLPAHYETPTLMITLDNFEQFYRPEGDDYALRLDAVRALMPEAAR